MKSSTNGSDEVAIFADTNMGTHIAIAVSPDITTSDFEREFERTHFSCFPKLGEVKACKVMVKRKGCFYCLQESLLIRYAFQGLQEPWFLHVEISPSSSLEKQIATDCDAHISDDRNMGDSTAGNTDTNDMVSNYKKCLKTFLVKPELVLNTFPCLEKKRKKKKQLDEFLGHGVGSFTTNSATIGSQLEMQSKAKNDGNVSEICRPPQFAVRTPTKTLHSLQTNNLTRRSSGNELRTKTTVGKRILTAANKLRVSRNKQRPSTYFFRGSLIASPGITSSVFEISDDDD